MGRAGSVELVWPGKYDEQGRRAAIPPCEAALRLDAIHPPDAPDAASDRWSDRLVLGDNLAVLQALLREHAGTADLVYIDPPFATGGAFSVSTRVGEGDSPPEIEAPAYSDRWDGGVGGFLAMLDPRLRLVRELMAPHGSLYIHVDPTVGHAVKLLADEVFGPDAFQREIVWRIGWVSGFKSAARNWIRNHDLIFFYVKDPKRFTFNKHYVPYPEGYRRRDGALPKGKGVPMDDVWNASPAELELRGRDSLDSIQIKSFSTEKSGYATQKNESLLRRIVTASSNPGDLVVDAFCGSGTTAVVAAELGRRFIACDASAPAIAIATKRVLGQPRRHPLRLESVSPWASEPLLEPGPYRTLVLEHHGARALDGGGALLQGRVGRALVHVAAPQHVLGAAELATIVDAARSRNAVALHVLAESFELPAQRESVPGLDLLLLRIGRDLADPRCQARTGAALYELPEVELAVHSVGGGELQLELTGYTHPHPRRLAEAVRQAVRVPTDFIDAWSVQWNADGSVHVPDVVHYRTHNRRALDLCAGPFRPAGKSPARVRVRIHDIVHQSTTLLVELRRRGRGWSVASMQQS